MILYGNVLDNVYCIQVLTSASPHRTQRLLFYNANDEFFFQLPTYLKANEKKKKMVKTHFKNNLMVKYQFQ